MKREVEYFRHYIDGVDSIVTENCIEPLVFDGLSVNGCRNLDELAISLEDDFKDTDDVDEISPRYISDAEKNYKAQHAPFIKTNHKQYLLIVDDAPMTKGKIIFDRDEAVLKFKRWKKKGNKVKLKYQKTLFCRRF